MSPFNLAQVQSENQRDWAPAKRYTTSFQRVAVLGRAPLSICYWEDTKVGERCERKNKQTIFSLQLWSRAEKVRNAKLLEARSIGIVTTIWRITQPFVVLRLCNLCEEWTGAAKCRSITTYCYPSRCLNFWKKQSKTRCFRTELQNCVFLCETYLSWNQWKIISLRTTDRDLNP